MLLNIVRIQHLLQLHNVNGCRRVHWGASCGRRTPYAAVVAAVAGVAAGRGIHGAAYGAAWHCRGKVSGGCGAYRTQEVVVGFAVGVGADDAGGGGVAGGA